MINTKSKIAAFVASAALVAMLGLVACGGSSSSSAAASSSAASASASSAAASSEAASSSAAATSAAATSASAASTEATSATTATSTAAVETEVASEIDTTNLEAYAGVSDQGDTYLLAMDANATEGILVIMNDSGDYLSFVGPIATQGNMLQISDQKTGDTFGFELTAASGQGDYLLDAGTAGQIVITQCDIEDVFTALALVDQYGTAAN